MKEITIQELEKMNPFVKIESEWMLLTAGNVNDYNPMTINWGTFGYLWHKNIAIVYIRPQRHTYNFAETNDYMTLSFFNESYRNILNICGSKSGRDIDKIKECNLHPIVLNNSIGYEEADINIVCKKIYADMIKDECFLNENIKKDWYPTKDYHKYYVLEIEHIYVK